MRHAIVLLAFACVTLACSGNDGAGTWAGSLDTLPNGTLVTHNPADGLWDSAGTWRLRETLRIGRADGTGPDVFGRVTSIAVDAWGRVYVLESQARQIRVFDANGRHVRTFGREGEGPGELRSPFGLAWGPDNLLWVPDAQGRFTAFDTTGAYVSERRRLTGFFRVPFPGFVDALGRIYDTGIRRGEGPGSEVVIRFDARGIAADTFELPTFVSTAETFEIPQRITVPVPFSATLRWHLVPGPAVWFGVTDSYRLYRRTLEGDTTNIVEREYSPPSVTAAERDSAVEALDWFTNQGGTVDASRIPHTQTAFHDFFVDDAGFLWVRPTRQPQSGTRLDVFDPAGRYLGPVQVPVTIPPYAPMLIRGAECYVVVRDELDVPYVVRLEIVNRGT